MAYLEATGGVLFLKELKMPAKKKGSKRGRPVEKPMPKRIPDTPENIAKAMFRVGRKSESEWRYLKKKTP